MKSPTTPRTPSESGYCPALYRLGRVASPLAVGEAGAAGVGEGAARGHMVGGDGGRVMLDLTFTGPHYRPIFCVLRTSPY